MRVTYCCDDNRINYTSYEYIRESNIFTLKSNEEDCLEYIPALDLNPEYDPQNYKIIFLNNNATSENSIFEVRVKNGCSNWIRIGWIFPIQALLSQEHSQASNPYFLKYAYVATCCLFNELDKVIMSEAPEIFRLEDFFEFDRSLLVLDEENCSNIQGFLVDDYVVGLYKYGYTYCGEEQPQEELPQSTDSKVGILKLCKLSDKIKNNSYIQQLFKDQLPQTHQPLIRFHFYYQIIEILIEDIFEYRFSKIMRELDNNPENLFHLRDEVANISNEKYRVKLLFDNHSNNDTTTMEELNNSCKELLESLDRKTHNRVGDNLYAVRCLIVHKLYTMNLSEHMVSLNRINNSLLVCITNILFSYHVE